MVIVVKSEAFAKFLKIRAASAALDRRAIALRESFGLPESDSSTVGNHSIVDGNNVPVGKFTISPRAAYEVKASFVGKLS